MSSVRHLYRKAAASTLKAAKNWNVNDRGPEWELCLEIQREFEPWWGLGGEEGRVKLEHLAQEDEQGKEADQKPTPAQTDWQE